MYSKFTDRELADWYADLCRKEDYSSDDAFGVQNEIADRINIDPNETEQGFTEKAWVQLDEFVNRHRGAPEDPVAEHEAIGKVLDLADRAAALTGIGHGMALDEPVNLGSLNWANAAMQLLREVSGQQLNTDASGYTDDDPRHPSYYERMTNAWDIREGK